MKMTCRVLVVIALSVSFAQAKDMIKMKMFKTDQKTWNKPWTYALSSDAQTQPSQYKTIKKEITLSIDPAAQILWVCTSSPCKGTAKQLDLSDRKNDSVVALDGDGNPTFSTLVEVNYDIAATAPVKMKTIGVYKKIKEGTQWIVKSVNTVDEAAQKKIEYGKTTIKKDTTGLNTSKLKIPINTDFFVRVWIPGKEGGWRDTLIKKGAIRIDSVLLLTAGGSVEIEASSKAAEILKP